MRRWKYYKEWRHVSIDAATSGQWHEWSLGANINANWFPHFVRRDESTCTSTGLHIKLLWLRVAVWIWI